jgi:hypothetical protein
MRKLRIGYWPLSQSLGSAGDRRRLKFWAEARGHSVITNLSQKVDILVASENSDFNSPYFAKNNAPIVFDLIDAYLSPLNSLDDLTRGIAKKLTGQISGGIKPFSHHIKDFCLNSNAVICSSIEQKEIISKYCTNTHVILDSHDEIPLIQPTKSGITFPDSYRILWEGQPATIGGLKLISPALAQLSKSRTLSLDLVTDETYFKLLNRYFKKNTHNRLKRDLSEIIDLVTITPWSSKNLVEFARKCTVGVLPIDLSVPMQRLKPENRLLIMWRLGLPCLTSPSPAYARVATAIGADVICDGPGDWLSRINQLLQNPNDAFEQVTRGQEYLLERHSRAILLDKWDQVVESVL